MLKKKRANRWNSYTDKWDAVNLWLGPFGAEEAVEREEVLAEVVDMGDAAYTCPHVLDRVRSIRPDPSSVMSHLVNGPARRRASTKVRQGEEFGPFSLDVVTATEK